MPKNTDKKLSAYKTKRDLKRSGEPASGKRSAEGLKFVIQKHAARRLHYDLRLEAGGVLKSWAVPKGPSTDPKKRVLAVMVEDHPLGYADFEGIISEGNYGAGSVIVWDSGTYRVPGLSKAEAEKAILYGLDKGDFTFVLEGRKIRGRFTLARMKKDGNNWLLMKADDEFANLEIADDSSVKSGRIVPGRAMPDLPEIGKGAKAVMPKSIKPMLARLIEKPFKREGWIFELKLDGYRAVAFLNNSRIDIRSRNNLSLNERFSGLIRSLGKIPAPVIFDGEIVVLDRKGRPDFQLLREYLETGRGFPIYYVFDILYYGRSLAGLPLHSRKEILKKILPILPDVRYVEHVETEGILLLRSAEQAGIEGIIAKNLSSTYEEGKRSDDWLKIKITKTQEAVIGGYTAPQGGRTDFGALVLGVYQEKKLVYVGHCGSGFDESGLKLLKKRMNALRVARSPFLVEPKTNAPATWVKPELVCEVRLSGWTKDGFMRHPIFIGLRDDKKPEEVSRELPAQTEKFAARKTGVGLAISNPNKIFWPKDRYAKRDLVEYYDKIADVILPYLIDRPESLHRFPNGINGEEFYQKNLVDAPPEIRTIPLYSEAENKTVNYLLCQDKAALLYMANLGCIEINPWNSRIGSLDNPDYLILDLDPQGISFDNVVKVALATNDILKRSGITAYPKTSGATGLHICVPLGAKYDYEQAREFAHLINVLVNRRLPEITSLARLPGSRKNKVYLDYLQNRRGQTLAAPYSLKPLPGAPVSTPLKWSEVRPGLKPRDYHMKNIFSRLKKVGDLWEGVLGEGIDLLQAIDKLQRDYEKL